MSHDQHGCLFALQSCPMNGRVTGLTMSPWPGGWVLLWWMGWGSAAAVEMRQYPALQHTRLPIHLQCNWKSLFIRPWAVLCKANCAQLLLCACHGIFKIVQNCMINCLVYMWEVVLQKKWLDQIHQLSSMGSVQAAQRSSLDFQLFDTELRCG